jgi:hypothetical protein
MQIPSGAVDRAIFFVAVDASDLKTRETGLSSFTVYRSRNGGAATVYTTPTVAELSAGNMPGVYSLVIDEDTTLDAGHDTEEYCVHITQASMAPVTRVLELYRPKFTEGQTAAMASNAVTTVTTLTNAPADSSGVTTILAAVDTEVAAIKAKTDLIPASPAAVGSAMTLTSGERDAVATALLDLANGVESGKTLRQALRAMAAVLAGDVTGAGTATEVFKALGNAGTTRVTVPVDVDGNRTGVTHS